MTQQYEGQVRRQGSEHERGLRQPSSEHGQYGRQEGSQISGGSEAWDFGGSQGTGREQGTPGSRGYGGQGAGRQHARQSYEGGGSEFGQEEYGHGSWQQPGYGGQGNWGQGGYGGQGNWGQGGYGGQGNWGQGGYGGQGNWGQGGYGGQGNWGQGGYGGQGNWGQGGSERPSGYGQGGRTGYQGQGSQTGSSYSRGVNQGRSPAFGTSQRDYWEDNIYENQEPLQRYADEDYGYGERASQGGRYGVPSRQGESRGRAGSRQQGPFSGVGPKGYKRSDQRITEEINEALTDDGQLDASEIEVKVQDGSVTLTGFVNSRHCKRAAEDIVESVHGVQDVQNQLRVKQQRGQQSPSQSESGRSGGEVSTAKGATSSAAESKGSALQR